MKNGIAIIIGFILVGAMILGWKITEKMDETTSTPVVQNNMGDKKVEFEVPSMDKVPDGPLGESIKYGEKLMNETDTALDDYVGNGLSCASCHANGGTVQTASPFVGIAANYPDYRPREAQVFTLADRVNGCMVRSMNGKELAYDSKEMQSMVAYIDYLSTGYTIGEDLPWTAGKSAKQFPEPNVDDGEKIYTSSCIACHAKDGGGTGPTTGPAVWGKDSFNDGAGMARLTKMANYVQKNMPKGQGGTLSDQDAINVSAYILTHDRPEWKGHKTDWPKGGRPGDIMNKENREKVKNGTANYDEMLKAN